ncbi:alpha/beta hydrolase [Massilia sp. RP-1-19]|uniref:Alpha/beta hydrolase n=1 Tax=Massilia polaris TaxID=2728846 RepID=A0A848HN54_9BURK|nr:alpha/beta hydrolase [Massilia polaris]NML62437.1 alpha/beta hydrolase [Massilia polaris]
MSRSALTRRLFLISLLAVACAALAPANAAEFKSERITVSTEGKGNDVILIPGLGSSPRVWRELVRAVPGYRYHLVQVSGFAGHARGQNAEGTVAAPVAEEIARYIAAQGLDRPAIIGHSMGGTIGLMLASRHPNALSRLMVVDMLPFLGAMFGPPGTTTASVKPTADAFIAKLRTADPVARQARSAATIDSMVDNVAMRPGALDDSLKSDPDVVARAFHELIVTDLRPELAKIAVPTTVLYVMAKTPGVTEAAIDSAYTAAYAPLKAATLKRIPSSAHFIMWDQSEQFQSEVRQFLGK